MKHIVQTLILIILLSCTNNQTQQKNNVLDNKNIRTENTIDNIKNDCASLPQSFNSYDEAVYAIKNTKFTLTENINTAESDWIRSASFYSCDELTGYFILTTDKKEYLFKEIPIEVWNGFKNSSSFGSFYHQNIKGKYTYL